ncbi:MAG: redoxin domain-containing protein [Phycisphaerales bacterium]|nr:redoxin domain-containing protein [Phycisphaerales bacterium]
MTLARTLTLAVGVLAPAAMLLAQGSTAPTPLAPSKNLNPIMNTTPESEESTEEEAEAKPAKAVVGKPAPNFALKDTKGGMHQLSDFAGKYVVIEWFNPGCPYCRGIYNEGVVEDTIKHVKAIDSDAVYLAINSTANQPKEFVITQSDEFMTKQEMEDIPVLLDYDGAVGHIYEAKVTPHMYLINPEGVLIYAGAITDDRNFDKGDKAKNYVVDAVRASVSEGATPPAAVRPWGCGVKYADGGGTRGRRGGGRRGGDRPSSP